MKVLGFFAMLSFMLFSTSGFAQDQDMNVKSLMNMSLEDLLKVSVTSTLKEQKLLDVPSSVTVITAPEIKIRGYMSIKEVLRDVPGFNDIADTNEEVGGVRGVFVSTTNTILTLVNGHRMNEFFLGRYNLDQFLGLDAVERIEFVRGPVSATWGTGALSGVINIITKKGSSLNGSYAKVRTGVNSLQTGITTGYEVNGIDVMANFTYMDQKGQLVGQPANQEPTSTTTAGTAISGLPQAPGNVYSGRYPKNWAGMTTLSTKNSDLMLRAEHFDHVEARGAKGRFYNYESQPFKPDFAEQNFLVDYNYHFDFDALWKSSLSIRPSFHWFSFREVSFFNVGAQDAPPNGDRTGQQSEQQITELKLTYKADLLSNLNWTLGTDFIYANFYLSDGVLMTPGSSYTVVPNQNASPGDSFQSGYYTQLIWSLFEKLTFTGGLRYDRFHAQDKGVFSPRIASVYRFAENWSAKVAYGRSSLAPGRAHLSSENTSFLGNRNLAPEINDGIDLILMYDKPSSYKASVGVFQNWTKDFITGSGGLYVNSGKMVYRGLEAEGSYRLTSRLNVLGSYSFVDPNIVATTNTNVIDAQIKGIPTHTFRFGVSAEPLKRFTLSLMGRTTSTVKALDDLGLNRTIPVNTVLDFSALYELGSWDFQLIVRNLFDHKYYLANAGNNRPMPYGGSWTQVQVGYHF